MCAIVSCIYNSILSPIYCWGHKQSGSDFSKVRYHLDNMIGIPIIIRISPEFFQVSKHHTLSACLYAEAAKSIQQRRRLDQSVRRVPATGGQRCHQCDRVDAMHWQHTCAHRQETASVFRKTHQIAESPAHLSDQLDCAPSPLLAEYLPMQSIEWQDDNPSI